MRNVEEMKVGLSSHDETIRNGEACLGHFSQICTFPSHNPAIVSIYIFKPHNVFIDHKDSMGNTTVSCKWLTRSRNHDLKHLCFPICFGTIVLAECLNMIHEIRRLVFLNHAAEVIAKHLNQSKTRKSWNWYMPAVNRVAKMRILQSYRNNEFFFPRMDELRMPRDTY